MTTQKAITAVGIGVAVVGLLLCSWIAFREFRDSNAVVISGQFNSEHFQWKLNPQTMALFQKKPLRAGTHSFGPFFLEKGDSPFGVEWRSVDGGNKIYDFAFQLISTEGNTVWFTFGSTRFTRNHDANETTHLFLPVANVDYSGMYLLRGSIWDGKTPSSALSEAIVTKRKLKRGAYLPLEISRLPLFLTGYILMLVGLVVLLFRKRLGRLADSRLTRNKN